MEPFGLLFGKKGLDTRIKNKLDIRIKMKKVKSSTWVTVALLIYVSATAAYLLPRNHEVSDTEKYLTLAASYVIVLVLWLVLRKKEQMQQRRREEEHMNNLKK